MPKLNIDGYDFVGPNKIGRDELPAKPAVAIIATEAGEGIMILSVLESDNIARAVAESEWKSCWEKNSVRGVDVYLQLNSDRSQRETIRERIRERRRDTLRCEDFRIPDFE